MRQRSSSSSSTSLTLWQRRIRALIKSHAEGDAEGFYAAALQSAADEAQAGNDAVAREYRDFAERARASGMSLFASPTLSPVINFEQPRGELGDIFFVKQSSVKLEDLILSPDLERRLQRLIREQQEISVIQSHGLKVRRKLLLAGPPGTGKTMTASALSGALSLPLFSVRLEGLITKFLGETAQKLRLVFESIASMRGVYLFDEFDAIGSKRGVNNEVGEMRRVLNSFLQLLEQDQSQSVIVTATNHPELLDRALFRRFDDVLSFELPLDSQYVPLICSRLKSFDLKVDWSAVVPAAHGLAHAEVVSAADDAAKYALIDRRNLVTTGDILIGLEQRQSAHHSRW